MYNVIIDDITDFEDSELVMVEFSIENNKGEIVFCGIESYTHVQLGYSYVNNDAYISGYAIGYIDSEIESYLKLPNIKDQHPLVREAFDILMSTDQTNSEMWFNNEKDEDAFYLELSLLNMVDYVDFIEELNTHLYSDFITKFNLVKTETETETESESEPTKIVFKMDIEEFSNDVFQYETGWDLEQWKSWLENARNNLNNAIEVIEELDDQNIDAYMIGDVSNIINILMNHIKIKE